MAKGDYPNSGSLFRNEDKDDEHPNWADFQGKCEVDGEEYYMSAWKKKGKSGKPFMSISFKPVSGAVKATASTSSGTEEADDFF